MGSNDNKKLSPSLPIEVGSNTTFVQADPSTFRAVVQRLTGSSHRRTVLLSASSAASEIGARRRPAFKLHERRRSCSSIRKLDVSAYARSGALSPAYPYSRNRGLVGFPEGERVAAPSPVSPLDLLLFSPKRTPSYEEEEEGEVGEEGERRRETGRRAIAEKGFYCLRASPLNTPKRPVGGSQVPELLPLFPLTSSSDCTSPSS